MKIIDTSHSTPRGQDSSTIIEHCVRRCMAVPGRNNGLARQAFRTRHPFFARHARTQTKRVDACEHSVPMCKQLSYACLSHRRLSNPSPHAAVNTTVHHQQSSSLHPAHSKCTLDTTYTGYVHKVYVANSRRKRIFARQTQTYRVQRI